jgi:hypothetical protein
MWLKKNSLHGEYNELNDSHLRGNVVANEVLYQSCLTLLEKVEIEYFINEKIHKHNVLRFWVKIWCLTHVYSCSSRKS